MAYGIFRIQKVKASDSGELLGRLKHSAREYDGYENEMTPYNPQSLSSDKAFKKYKSMIKDCKKRTNSVGAFEVVLTSSEVKDWKIPDYADYLKKAQDFALDTFGKENLITGYVHVDEKVPHVHLFFVPVVTQNIKKKQTEEERQQGIQRTETVKQLNAKHWFNGKNALHELQNQFYDSVSSQFGFERGELAEITHRKNQRPQLNYDVDKLHQRELDVAIREKTVALREQKCADLEERQSNEDKRLSFVEAAHKRFYSAFFEFQNKKDRKNLINARVLYDLNEAEQQECYNLVTQHADSIRLSKKANESRKIAHRSDSKGKGGRK